MHLTHKSESIFKLSNFSMLLPWGQPADSLASLVSSTEYSTACKILQADQLLITFHISLPLRNRDVKSFSLILAIQKLSMLGNEELPSESTFISSDNRYSLDTGLTGKKKEAT